MVNYYFHIGSNFIMEVINTTKTIIVDVANISSKTRVQYWKGTYFHTCYFKLVTFSFANQEMNKKAADPNTSLVVVVVKEGNLCRY